MADSGYSSASLSTMSQSEDLSSELEADSSSELKACSVLEIMHDPTLEQAANIAAAAPQQDVMFDSSPKNISTFQPKTISAETKILKRMKKWEESLPSLVVEDTQEIQSLDQTVKTPSPDPTTMSAEIQTIQNHTSVLLNLGNDKLKMLRCMQYKATRLDLFRRYIVFVLAGIAFLLPYHCFTLSTPYIVSNMFVTNNTTDSFTDCKIDSPYLRETWPTIVIWILQVTGVLTMGVIHWYSIVKNKVIMHTKDHTGVLNADVYYKGSGQCGHMFRAVVFGTIEVCLLVASTFIFMHLDSWCAPLVTMVGLLGMTCLLAVTANVIQISAIATAAIFGKYNINAFTIGLDLGGCLVAFTSFINALMTQSQDILAFFIESVILVMLFVFFTICFARSKDYCTKMMEYDHTSNQKSNRVYTLSNGQHVLGGSQCATVRSSLCHFLWIQFLLFWQTFTVFPGVFLSVMPYTEHFIHWWYSLTVFLNFSSWALFFSIMAPYIYKKVFANRSNRFLVGNLGGVFLVRMIIIFIVYLGTNYKPQKPRPTGLADPFVGDWAYAILVSMFAISHSYVSSLSDIAIGYECSKMKGSKVNEQGGKLALVRNMAIILGLVSNLLLNTIY